MTRKIKIDNSILKQREYKKRTEKSKEIVCKILIVCEGSKTEPDYFRAFNKKKPGLYVVDIEIGGGGINTTGVVDKAIKLRKQASSENRPYDSVWAVFDKDGFPDGNFNGAINRAENNNIGCAWSNEAFELWYLLHFQNRNTPMGRLEYQKAISKAVNDSGFYERREKYVYQKNDPGNYSIMNRYGSQEFAIKNAKALEENYSDRRFASHNPCTKVHHLLFQLTGSDEVFNEEIKRKVNEEK